MRPEEWMLVGGGVVAAGVWLAGRVWSSPRVRAVAHVAAGRPTVYGCEFSGPLKVGVSTARRLLVAECEFEFARPAAFDPVSLN